MIPSPRTAPDADDTEADAARAAAIRDLVDRARAGDRQAFGQVWAAYSDTVIKYVYYRVTSKVLAEDLASETWIRALRRIETFDWKGVDFGAWLVTIARNLIADHYKSSRHRLEVSTGEMLDGDETAPSPEDAVMQDASEATVHAAVASLGYEQQLCIRLRFLQGLSVAETAAAMGKNEGAIKTMQYRATRTLARNPQLLGALA